MMRLVTSLALTLIGCRSAGDAPEVVSTTPPPPTTTDAPEVAPADATAPSPVKDEWWRDAVGYEIFVRSFQDTNGDGIGDLRGIQQRLDHLTRLGVDLVWLMPIHPSPSYHGYDVTDYRDVNPEYGTLAELDALVAAGKERGIRFIIDLLLNHSSDRHQWFLDSRKGPASPKFDWYVWRDTAPDPIEGWARPWDGASLWHELAGPAGSRWYYALFWGGMPDLNIANPAVQAEMEDVMAFWLGRGIAGFRVDAIRYLVETKDARSADTAETHAYLKGLRSRFDGKHPGALLLGEAWSSAEDQAGYYGEGDELHMAFSFDMAAAIVESARDGVRSRLNQMLDRSADVFVKDRGFEAPFLTNHDMPRVAREMMKDPTRLRVAAAVMLASPGTPFLYYGEEIGMVGGAARDDQNKRTPMRWTKAGPTFGFTTGEPWWPMTDEADGVDVETHAADPGSLMSLYERLVKTRKAHVALRRGDQRRLDVKGGKGVVAFVRTAPGGERALVVVNLDKEAVPAFPVPIAGRPTVLVAEGLDQAPTSDGTSLTIPGLGPRAFAWIGLD
ncbi:MAG: alpha-amylase [Deltaproteobacteria bacterium]|nr:alpha-amylase [Deltaproteobacteria bacterium]